MGSVQHRARGILGIQSAVTVSIIQRLELSRETGMTGTLVKSGTGALRDRERVQSGQGGLRGKATWTNVKSGAQ